MLWLWQHGLNTAIDDAICQIKLSQLPFRPNARRFNSKKKALYIRQIKFQLCIISKTRSSYMLNWEVCSNNPPTLTTELHHCQAKLNCKVNMISRNNRQFIDRKKRDRLLSICVMVSRKARWRSLRKCQKCGWSEIIDQWWFEACLFKAISSLSAMFSYLSRHLLLQMISTEIKAQLAQNDYNRHCSACV